ncbi:MAG: hypothetical protein SPK37_05970, partial [Candidatus Limisoma sp.]|nr:hypothetical protein [Candidatus Limisoma sp.]
TANAAITISGRQFSPTVHAIVVHSLMFFTNVSIFAETCRYFFQKKTGSTRQQSRLSDFSNE